MRSRFSDTFALLPPWGGVLQWGSRLSTLVFCSFLVSKTCAQFPTARNFFVDVPNGSQTNKSFYRSSVPFNNFEVPQGRVPARYQQVYAASQFSQLPKGGAFLSHIWFRAGCSSLNSVTFSNAATIVVRASHTQKPPDGLSAVFAENLEEDQMVVFTNTLYFVLGDAIDCTEIPLVEDGDWASELNLTTPFFYNPAKGNLLLQFDVPIGSLSKPNYVDKPYYGETVAVQNDSISRAYADSLSATTATTIDTEGLITWFWFAPRPMLYAYLINGGRGLRLAWPTDPQPMRLQFSDTLEGGGAWVQLAQQTVGDQLVSFVDFPAIPSSSHRYYRLYWNSPQLGLPPVEVMAAPPAEASTLSTH